MRPFLKNLLFSRISTKKLQIDGIFSKRQIESTNDYQKMSQSGQVNIFGEQQISSQFSAKVWTQAFKLFLKNLLASTMNSSASVLNPRLSKH